MSDWYTRNYPALRRMAVATPFALMKSKLYTKKSTGSVYGPKAMPKNYRKKKPMNRRRRAPMKKSSATPTLASRVRQLETRQKDTTSKLIYKYDIKNNYQIPCIVTFGVAFPKEDTSITPNAAFTNGLADIGNPDSTSTLLSFKDSPQFRELWSVKLRSKLLRPGQQIIVKHFQKQFTFDPSLQDSHGMTYQRNVKSAVFLYRCQGVLGHDSTVVTEQGILPSGIDVYISTTYIITYNSGGASIKTIVLSENATQTFTNTPVVSQPVQDNQSYSLN